MPKKSRRVTKTKGSYKKQDPDKIFRSVDSYKVNPEPFPRVLLTRCKYADNRTLVMAAPNAAHSFEYRMTDIWDPEKSVGGTTVAGQAQLAAIYDRYQVMGAKCIFSFATPTNATARVGYRIRLGGAAPCLNESLEKLASQPLTYMTGLSTTGSQSKTFTAYIKPWTVHGISKLEYMANSSQYTSGISSGPLNKDLALVDVFVCDRGNTTTVELVTKIIYYVKFYARKQLLMV